MQSTDWTRGTMIKPFFILSEGFAGDKAISLSFAAGPQETAYAGEGLLLRLRLSLASG